MLGNNLVFLDSFQFMSFSLDRLAANLPEEKYKYTSGVFKNDQLALMKKNGVYPYDFMDGFDKFDYKELPTKNEFFSMFTQEGITNEQYQHAQQGWDTFKSMGEYHDLYLKSDVLLLADIFENFRSTCLQYYKLDPTHYFTSPGLSWSAMLKRTGIKLELMSNVDQYQFIEKGMRGVISYIANRHLEANNPYIKGYNSKKPNTYIMYLDANNLYGWAMSQCLPTGGFKWLTPNQINKLDIHSLDPEEEKGLILEVDLEYPHKLHDLQNDYTLAAEKMKVTKNLISPYCKQILEKYDI